MKCSVKPSRSIPDNDLRKVYRGTKPTFLKASKTTDSIKILSITFCTLATVYCACKIAKGAFKIVLYVTTFYMQHCAVACLVLKQQCSTNRCQCQKGELTCTKLYACSDDDEPCEKALQEDDGDEYVDDNDESDNSYDNVSDSDEDNKFICELCLYHTFKGRLVTVLRL